MSTESTNQLPENICFVYYTVLVLQYVLSNTAMRMFHSIHVHGVGASIMASLNMISIRMTVLTSRYLR